MQKIIWTCWFQGRREAPELVQKCLDSWEAQNPTWDFRCLDAETVSRYVSLDAYIDLKTQTITAASLSDILRLLLLHEYGGVWVDATTHCNRPLDDWLPLAAYTGFFAFARPGEDRELSTWFLAAQPGNALLAKWAACALDYWRGRERTQDYFWVHHQFGELCAIDSDAFRDWQATPRISADGPHSIQFVGMYADYDSAAAKIDWTVPVFKLTYRMDESRLGPNALVARLLGLSGASARIALPQSAAPGQEALQIGMLKVSTANLGDHIQILAGRAMLQRAGLQPSFLVDRDDEIAHPPPIEGKAGAGILMNGWFKTNPAEWPPHPDYTLIYLGFHIRLFQSPSLVSPAALDHYAANGPVGCRDRNTLSLLTSHGIDAFLSHCLTLTFPRRLPDPERQNEIFVVSRDQQFLEYLPASVGPYNFISQYSESGDFSVNLLQARELIQTYHDRAKLIITTMLHCALPAIAMGIPVVVFFPPNEGAAHQSDIERFSSLSELVRVFHPSEASLVDWRGYSPDVSALKLRLVDAFFAMAEAWGPISPPRVVGIADPSAMPDTYDYFNDPERLERLARAKAPDRQKWGASSSYRADWAARGVLAARHIPDGSRVLEIGTGGGAFRQLVAGRCRYTGTDLQPIDKNTLALNIETDPLPHGPWDVAVVLGVLEYLHDPIAALNKVSAAAQTVILSYCIPRGPNPQTHRSTRGWINALSEQDLVGSMTTAGLSLNTRDIFNAAADFEQIVFAFCR